MTEPENILLDLPEVPIGNISLGGTVTANVNSHGAEK